MHDTTWRNHPGAIAGAVGTAAMDLALYVRYRASGSDRFLPWECGAVAIIFFIVSAMPER
jgi:hypothetical protein